MDLDRRASGTEQAIDRDLDRYYAPDRLRVRGSVHALTDVQQVLRVHPILLLQFVLLAVAGLVGGTRSRARRDRAAAGHGRVPAGDPARDRDLQRPLRGAGRRAAGRRRRARCLGAAGAPASGRHGRAPRARRPAVAVAGPETPMATAGRGTSPRSVPQLVIGAGFLGTHVSQALAARGIATRVMTRSPLDDERADRLGGPELIVADASVRPAVAAALDGVDHVYFCAGGLMPAESNLDPAADVALALPPVLNVLEALRAQPATGLTFISSGGTVYGPPERVPVREDHPTEPVTSYGVMKLTAEKYVLMYSRLYGVSARLLRCSNVYGPYQRPARGQGFIAAALHRIRRGEPVVVFGDGLNVRDYVFAPDVARAMVDLAAIAGGPAVLNVGSGAGISLRDLLALIARVTGAEPRIEERPDRGFDVREIVLDVGALSALVEPPGTSLGGEA